MGRPLRIQDKETIYFVSNRCLEARFYLRPSEEINALILGWLARAATIYKVRLFFYVFMSNHFHMGVQAPEMNLHGFMGYFEGNLAKALNRKEFLNRTGPVFGQRYRAEPILDDAELRAKMEYTLNNPVRAGLVHRIEEWPGLSSYNAHLSGEAVVARWASQTELSKVRQRAGYTPGDEEAVYKEYAIELMPLPQWRGKSRQAYAEAVTELVRQGSVSAAKERQRKKVLGRKGVLKQKFHQRPHNPKFSICPLCHTTDSELEAQYRKRVENVTAQYRQAIHRLREGDWEVRFPRGTIPPGWRRCVGEADVQRQSMDDSG